MPESPVPEDMAQSQGSDVFVILDLIPVKNVTTDEDQGLDMSSQSTERPLPRYMRLHHDQ